MARVQWMRRRLETSPLLARAAPFVLFLVLTALQGRVGEASHYWIYLGKTVAGAWLIWLIRPYVAEMRWAISWEAGAVGLAVFFVWVGLDPYYPKFGKPGPAWNPHAEFGSGTGLAWLCVVGRVLGSSLVVPPLEEVFYRSFVYRFLVKQDFLAVPLGAFAWMPLLVTSGVFGLSHFEWLAGGVCGLAFQALVIWKKRLGDAMTAHAITNLLLGLWVVWKGAWHFW